MKLHELERSQTVPAAVDAVFEFFKKPENLERLTPAGLGFRILTPGPITMREGALIDYTIRLSGLPVRWTTLITRYEPPHLFVDEQLKGPYAYWHHTHEFRPAPGGTEVRDRVVYALPFGPAGELAHRLRVRKMLEGIFDHRARAIRSEFAG